MLVARHPSICLLLALNLLVFATANLGNWRTRFGMERHQVQIMTTIATFFEVFYASACYTRYIGLWDLDRKMCGSIYDFVLQVCIATGHAGKPYDRVATRWLVVAHLLFLNERRSGKQASPECWDKLLALSLVNQEELAFLSPLRGSQRSLVMLHATADLARAGALESKASANVVLGIVQSLLDYRDLQQEVEDFRHFQFPFGYFHLANLIIVVSSITWSYFMGLSVSMFAPLLFLASTLVFVAILDLAANLADPYGNDDADFPVHRWTAELLQNLTVLLEVVQASSTSGFGAELEECARKRPKLCLDLADVANVLFGGEAGLPRAAGCGTGDFGRGLGAAGGPTAGETAGEWSPRTPQLRSAGAEQSATGCAGGGVQEALRGPSPRRSSSRWGPLHIVTSSA